MVMLTKKNSFARKFLEEDNISYLFVDTTVISLFTKIKNNRVLFFNLWTEKVLYHLRNFNKTREMVYHTGCQLLNVQSGIIKSRMKIWSLSMQIVKAVLRQIIGINLGTLHFTEHAS